MKTGEFALTFPIQIQDSGSFYAPFTSRVKCLPPRRKAAFRDLTTLAVCPITTHSTQNDTQAHQQQGDG